MEKEVVSELRRWHHQREQEGWALYMLQETIPSRLGGSGPGTDRYMSIMLLRTSGLLRVKEHFIEHGGWHRACRCFRHRAKYVPQARHRPRAPRLVSDMPGPVADGGW